VIQYPKIGLISSYSPLTCTCQPDSGDRRTTSEVTFVLLYSHTENTWPETLVMPAYEAPSITSSENGTAISNSDNSKGPRHSRKASHLRPEDAFYNTSPPDRSRSPLGRSDTITANNVNGESSSRRRRDKHRSRDGGGRVNRTWKKLLWVKQACMSPICARAVAELSVPKSHALSPSQTLC